MPQELEITPDECALLAMKLKNLSLLPASCKLIAREVKTINPGDKVPEPGPGYILRRSSTTPGKLYQIRTPFLNSGLQGHGGAVQIDPLHDLDPHDLEGCKDLRARAGYTALSQECKRIIARESFSRKHSLKRQRSGGPVRMIIAYCFRWEDRLCYLFSVGETLTLVVLLVFRE